MTWKIRHEGSPRSIEGMNLTQVVEGLQDGLWEPTDEVMGPDDSTWVAIENHPQLEELALDYEAPPPAHRADETNLDMNPLIDVCLVLLIFFILTTSYAALQKVLDMPGASNKVDGIKVVKAEDAKAFTIKVEARKQGDQSVILVEDREVEPRNLISAIKGYMRDERTNLLIDAREVEWDTVVQIMNAGKGAGVRKLYFAMKADEVPKK